MMRKTIIWSYQWQIYMKNVRTNIPELSKERVFMCY